jgi:hypothetical protein
LYASGATLGQSTFLYSPAFAQAFWPLTLLPWLALRIGWALVALVGYWWMVRPLPLSLRLPALGIAACSAYVGNIDWLIALAVAASAAYPGAWAIVLLSRVTPAVGILWYPLRRQWRALATAVICTAACVAISVALGPSLWGQWLGILSRSAGGGQSGDWLGVATPPLLPRLAVAAVVVAFGARRSWRPSIAIAALLALPDMWPWSPAILLAIPRLSMEPGRG